MTRSTDELTRLLTGAADDIVERDRVPGPDAPVLWRRGRRTTWAVRASAAALAALLVLVLGSLVVVLGPVPTSLPAGTGRLTYPEYVSDLMPGNYQSRGRRGLRRRHRRAERHRPGRDRLRHRPQRAAGEAAALVVGDDRQHTHP